MRPPAGAAWANANLRKIIQVERALRDPYALRYRRARQAFRSKPLHGLADIRRPRRGGSLWQASSGSYGRVDIAEQLEILAGEKKLCA